MTSTRILIVEDERIIAEDLRECLELMGYEVMGIATSGQQAIDLVGAEQPDLMLMDINLRGDIDGVEVARQLSGSVDVPVIFLSAFADKQIVERAKQVGPFGYLVKPYKESELRTTIEVTLYKHQVELQNKSMQLRQQHQLRELKAREREVRKLSYAVEFSPAAIAISDPQGWIEYVNAAFCELTGHAAAAVQGTALAELLGGGQAAELEADIRRGIDQSGVWRGQLRVLKPDGEPLWIAQSIASIRSAADQIDHWVSVGEDISEKIRKERRQTVCHQMREQVWKMQRPDDIAEVVAILQRGLQTLEINYSGCGVNVVEEDDEAVEIKFHHLTPAGMASDRGGDADAKRLIAEIWRSGHPLYRRDLQCEDRFGERERIESSFGPVRSVIDVPFSHGTIAVNSHRAEAFSPEDIESLKLLGEILSEGYRRSQDLEALERTERQLLQAQKMEAIGQLAGGVAHDFNNMVSVVTGYCGLMMQDLDEEHPHYPFVVEIDKAGNKTAKLVRQLLAFSRRQTTEPEVLDLNAVVEDMDKMLRRLIGEDKELVAELGSELHRVMADPGHIEQVIMNLVINARDAIEGSGRIEVKTANITVKSLADPDYPGVDPGEYVMLRVSDSGCGMDRDTQERIFEPFFTTKDEGAGTGLGLATVYGIVKQSGGCILVDSEPGAGTTFRILLPRTRGEWEAVQEGGRVDLAALAGSETILVAEDDVVVLNLVQNILRLNGYTTIGAERGDEALRLCEEQGVAADLLLTDVVMPGIAGPELAKKAKARLPGIKVVYMSGHTTNIFVNHGLVANDATLLNKPFTLEELLTIVRQTLDEE